MSDEIKEILQMLEAMASNDDIAFLPRQASLLLDYITNLQERIDKAIEVLEAMKHIDKFLSGYSRSSNIDKVINILKGDSNE